MRLQGFTFVEIVLVLGIIAGLAATSYAYIQSTIQSNQNVQLFQDINLIRTATFSWRQSNGSDFTNLDTDALRQALLIPERLNCALDADISCSINPFGTRFDLAADPANPAQFILTITPASTTATVIASVQAFYQNPNNNSASTVDIAADNTACAITFNS
ncbi:MAG: type II secretion system protein [Gammaproteobacteria bacterium]